LGLAPAVELTAKACLEQARLCIDTNAQLGYESYK